MRLAGKVAIITGSAGGMGKLAAELFASEGASVVVTDIAEKEGEETARAIRDTGGISIFVKANVAIEDEVERRNAGRVRDPVAERCHSPAWWQPVRPRHLLHKIR